VREVLVYCRDHRCSHSTTMSADRWPDHVRLSDIEPGFVCTACGKRGAEVRPKFSLASMGIGQCHGRRGLSIPSYARPALIYELSVNGWFASPELL
jgi:hypothetical protein